MTLSAHNRLVIAGFVVAYLGGMGALITRSADALGAARPLLQEWLFLPALGLGLLLILVGKILGVTREDGPST